MSGMVSIMTVMPDGDDGVGVGGIDGIASATNSIKDFYN